MSTFIETAERVDLRDAVRLLKEKVGEIGPSLKSGYQINRISREIKCEVSLLDWLKSAKADSKIYWSDRDGGFEMAGLGNGLVLSANNYSDVENVVNRATDLVNASAEGVRIYGGIRFPSNGKHGESVEWQPFGSARFVVPRLELIKNKGKFELAVNFTKGDNSELVQKEIEEFFPESFVELEANSRFVRRTDLPDFGGWESVVNSVIGDFGRGKIEKIVLARQTTIEFKERCDGFELLKKLSVATPKCFHFCFQPTAGTSFLGASPELLYARKNREIISEALAGTKPRGKDENSDKLLADELLESDKELREHKYVVDNIKSALQWLCESYRANDNPEVLKLAQVQHLRTEFKGELRGDTTDADILGALHPTAAVGGFPSDEARNRISECEEFDRGWYAGAVGWLGKDEAELAVAIRSGLARGKELKLHSGAGIIKGSAAQAEWDEIESKIASFLSAVSG